MSSDKHILLIDDDRDLSDLLTDVLTTEGYSVIAAGSGDAAFQYLESCEPGHLPKIIILDFCMPGMNGAQFLASLKKLKNHAIRNIPVIMSSGASDEEMHDVANRIKRVPKPFELNEMLLAIAEIF